MLPVSQSVYGWFGFVWYKLFMRDKLNYYYHNSISCCGVRQDDRKQWCNLYYEEIKKGCSKQEGREDSNLFRILPPSDRLATIFASTCWLSVCFVLFLCFLLSFCSCSICLIGHCLMILLPIMQRVPSKYKLLNIFDFLFPNIFSALTLPYCYMLKDHVANSHMTFGNYILILPVCVLIITLLCNTLSHSVNGSAVRLKWMVLSSAHSWMACSYQHFIQTLGLFQKIILSNGWQPLSLYHLGHLKYISTFVTTAGSVYSYEKYIHNFEEEELHIPTIFSCKTPWNWHIEHENGESNTTLMFWLFEHERVDRLGTGHHWRWLPC